MLPFYYYNIETGLYYLIARYYDPELGRFISEDTYKGTIQDPLTLNYYIYCKGNPIKYIDPSGHAGELVGKLFDFGKIIAAITGAGYKTAKTITPVGIFGAIISKPSKAGETDKDLKNDKAFQKAVSGGGTGDPGKGNNKKDKKNDEIKTPDNSSKDFTKLKGNQGYKDSSGNTWKKDKLHKDHWDISDKKGNKIREVDFNGNEIWPNGPKNNNKRPR